jgi:hypothetical protein
MSSRASTDSISSCSSVKSRASSYESGILSRSGSVRSTTTRSGSLRSRRSRESTHLIDSWPSRKTPMLRLATPPPLETIPGSPFPKKTPSVYSHSPSSSVDSHDDHRFTIRPHTTDLSPQSTPATPSFKIQSTSSERRNKMERLRRKLGDEVPIDLVFPHEGEPTYVTSPLHEEQEFAIPSVMPDFRRAPRISSARDSISLDSPHRALRRMGSHKASCQDPLPAATDCAYDERQRVSAQHNASDSSDMHETKATLCVIVESPSEHGFVLSRRGARPESEWYESDDEAEDDSWSSMTGFEGCVDEYWDMSYRKCPMTP